MRQKTMRVTITGIEGDLAKERQYLADLGLEYREELEVGVDLLVVGSTCTEKFWVAQMANIFDEVTIDWVLDSHESGLLLPYQGYKVPSIFYHCPIGICGFTPQQTETITNTLTQHSAEVHSFSIDPKQVNPLPSNIKVLVTTKLTYRKLSYYQLGGCPIVGVEWVEDSIRSGTIRNPRYYAFNYSQIWKKSPNQHNKIIECAPSASMMGLEKEICCFDGCLVYVEDSLDRKMKNFIHRWISIGHGAYLSSLVPLITHVVVPPNIKKKHYHELLKYGDSVHIVRIDWFFDRLMFGQAEEADYYIRYFEHEDPVSTEKIHHSLTTTLSKKISVSHPIKVESRTEIRKKAFFKSTIFKNINFYLHSLIRKEKELVNIVRTVRENGGVVYDGIKKNKLMYCILTDTPETEHLFETITKQTGAVVLPISYRWIHYCSKKGEFLDPQSQNYFIFKPFRFRVPLPSFMVCKFEITGVNDILKLRIRELLCELGSKKTKPSKSEITHCLCGEDYLLEPHAKRIKEIRSVNLDTQFLSLPWLFECLNTGQMTSSNQFIISF